MSQIAGQSTGDSEDQMSSSWNLYLIKSLAKIQYVIECETIEKLPPQIRFNSQNEWEVSGSPVGQAAPVDTAASSLCNIATPVFYNN